MSTRTLTACAALVTALVLPAAASAGARDDARVQRGLRALVHAEGGPPGAIATMWRGGRTTVLRAGYGDRATRRRPRAGDHMRIASVAKAFSGAVALRLVARRPARTWTTRSPSTGPTCRPPGPA